MLITKDVKIIKDADKKTYTSWPFEAFNFESASNDETVEYKPKTEGKQIQFEGKDFVGSKPKNEVTPVTSDDAVQMLLAEAVGYCENVSQEPRVNKKGEPVANPYTVVVDDVASPIQNAGLLYLLSLATAANTARLRLELDATNREKVVDLAAVRAAYVKNLVKGGEAKDERDAYRQVARNEAMNAVEAAEEAGKDLTMKQALLDISWYQEYLKSLPTAAPATA